MNIYPRPSEWEPREDLNSEEQDYDDDDYNCADIHHSSTGLCPCCGADIEEGSSVRLEGGFFQNCLSCGWYSGTLYDD